jgi:hypothetical protein
MQTINHYFLLELRCNENTRTTLFKTSLNKKDISHNHGKSIDCGLSHFKLCSQPIFLVDDIVKLIKGSHMFII